MDIDLNKKKKGIENEKINLLLAICIFYVSFILYLLETSDTIRVVVFFNH
jgi:hypothetical protein